jgi:hypothetical protein
MAGVVCSASDSPLTSAAVPCKRSKLVRGTQEYRPFSLLDQDTGTKVACAITDAALRDLIDFHRLNSADSDLIHVVVSELVRLANAKYNAARYAENGELLIHLPDLLLYGFAKRDKSAA